MTAPEEIMKKCLEDIVEGEATPSLTVVYSDMHGLWGGTAIAMAATGEYELTEREPGGDPQRRRGCATRQQFRDLCVLLLDLQAWEQRCPERPPAPDESRAMLTLRSGRTKASIWEWYADLAPNQRLVRIRDTLLALVALPR